MKYFLTIAFVLLLVLAKSQNNPNSWKNIYRATSTKINDLVHTKLNAAFDYSKSQLIGKVWITLQPHFYATDSLQLDAKGMKINQVALFKNEKIIPLKYTYNNRYLHIQLDKSYNSNEQYTIYIDYVANPNEFAAMGSEAIKDAKGLYFINPLGTDKEKPIQIWTQGETEATSVWIPTIDKPNQKCTQEFNLTIPAQYVSLSNGKLVKQQINMNGTRTDKWVMDLPHAPYLFFIGIGNYAIVKDSYKGKEVSYYVEKEYEKVARNIFGNTPEMMAFFSNKLGVEFPWAKYSQIVGRDFVSGAMENTTATLHQESAQQDARELLDGNVWESTISHELFHQWFGDYVTAESWSNLTVNESFANYSEILWTEYKYGKDYAAFDNLKDMQAYFSSSNAASNNLVRFYYESQEDLFDLVSYHKGGRILNMLRSYVGDVAFYAALNKYLTDNSFGNGSAHKLRMAFESITGKDLNWFFNQWYFNHGHPKLSVTYNYNQQDRLVKVLIKQTQEDIAFKLPIKIDIYENVTKKSYSVYTENKIDSFYFPAASKPQLINIDPDGVLLAEKKENKSIQEYAYQYKHGISFNNRNNALDAALLIVDDSTAIQILKDALNDPFFRIRIKALNGLELVQLDEATLNKIANIVKTDSSKLVIADAIQLLGKQKDIAYLSLFNKAIGDSSYSVAGAALYALSMIDSSAAYRKAIELSKQPTKGRLNNAITAIIAAFGDENAFDFIASSFSKMPISSDKLTAAFSLSDCLVKVNDIDKFKKGIDLIVAFREALPKESRKTTDVYINEIMLKNIASNKEKKGLQNFADYIKLNLPK